jgi:8-oxo-dGTP pyrophosphatase MutT (NUDIX family)
VGYVEELRALVGHRPLLFVADGALIFDDDGRLLLIERSDTREWASVGGIMDPGETIEETVRREAREEVGIDLGELRFLGVFSGPDYRRTLPNGDQVAIVPVIYTAGHTGQPLQLDPTEVLQAGFFRLDQLPSPMRPSTLNFIRAYQSANGHH